MDNTKKTILSGIQPSGTLTIGNYLGSLNNWVKLQNDYNCYYCIVDMHAITVRQVPAELRRRSVDMLALYIAAGINPQTSTIFIQSHVPEHAQLSWVLSCYTMFGELSRMTQFKDKSARHSENINAGLFTYPVLMAADILLYMADLVPVGQDQKQHLELARNIAVRFNHEYSDTFKVPEPYIPKESAKIKSLLDPLHKMDKSDDSGGSIFLLDDRDTIIRKVKRAVTDSDSYIAFDEDKKPGISNLLTIYSCFSGKSVEDSEKEFSSLSYAELKLAVGETVADSLRVIQDEFYRVRKEKDMLDTILRDGAEKASAAARRTISKVYKKIGFYQYK